MLQAAAFATAIFPHRWLCLQKFPAVWIGPSARSARQLSTGGNTPTLYIHQHSIGKLGELTRPRFPGHLVKNVRDAGACAAPVFRFWSCGMSQSNRFRRMRPSWPIGARVGHRPARERPRHGSPFFRLHNHVVLWSRSPVYKSESREMLDARQVFAGEPNQHSPRTTPSSNQASRQRIASPQKPWCITWLTPCIKNCLR